jgi:hypothetical protein
MPSRSSKGRDFVAIARNVVEKAIGEHLDGTPLEDPVAGKNPAAVALGKLRHLPAPASAAKRIDKGAYPESARRTGELNEGIQHRLVCGSQPVLVLLRLALDL